MSPARATEVPWFVAKPRYSWPGTLLKSPCCASTGPKEQRAAIQTAAIRDVFMGLSGWDPRPPGLRGRADAQATPGGSADQRTRSGKVRARYTEKGRESRVSAHGSTARAGRRPKRRWGA